MNELAWQRLSTLKGVKNFVEYINEGKDVLHPVASFEGENATIEVEMAFQFNDGYSENILSFVNNVRTRGAGSHESGMKAAMTRIFNDYARRVNLLKEKIKISKVAIFVKVFQLYFLFVFQKKSFNSKVKRKKN